MRKRAYQTEIIVLSQNKHCGLINRGIQESRFAGTGREKTPSGECLAQKKPSILSGPRARQNWIVSSWTVIQPLMSMASWEKPALSCTPGSTLSTDTDFYWCLEWLSLFATPKLSPAPLSILQIQPPPSSPSTQRSTRWKSSYTISHMFRKLQDKQGFQKQD